MRNVFEHQISNVVALLVGVDQVMERGAEEAALLLVTGKPGLGKTEAVRWFVTQQPHAVYLRAKTGWTRHWFLSDLLTELGVERHHLSEVMFQRAKEALAKRPYILVVDEVEHTLSSEHKVLEAIRDFSDLLEMPVLLVGMPEVKAALGHKAQIWSRIVTTVEFMPITLADVALAARTLLPDVTLAEDLVAELHRQSQGRMRLLKNGLATCERAAKDRKTNALALADLDGVELIHDFTARKPQPLKPVRQA